MMVNEKYEKQANRRRAERAEMVRIVAEEARDTADWLGKEAFDRKVLDALMAVPRHAFVPPLEAAAAYENRPLPIGEWQTISQPFIVAAMTDQAEVDETSRVLEVGTGCGYQAAVLAALGAEVYTVEALPGLAEAAAERLARLGYDKVHCRQGDGAKGWPKAAPFDAILVTAAAKTLPRNLLDQLAPGGRMIVPLEAEGGTPAPAHWLHPEQVLMRIHKAEDGSHSERILLPVAFVPLIKPPKTAKR